MRSRCLCIPPSLLRGEIGVRARVRVPAGRQTREPTAHPFELVVPQQIAGLGIDSPNLTTVCREERLAVPEHTHVVGRAEVRTPDAVARPLVERDDGGLDSHEHEYLRITWHGWLHGAVAWWIGSVVGVKIGATPVGATPLNDDAGPGPVGVVPTTGGIVTMVAAYSAHRRKTVRLLPERTLMQIHTLFVVAALA